MPDAARKRIGELLRREDALHAREAARLFLQHTDEASVSSGIDHRSDEAQAILADSFQRLAGVAALSLQVDEPRLLSEELQWLQKTMGASFPAASEHHLDLLIGSFTGAYRKSLNDADCKVLQNLFSQARSGMSDLEPLLTDPRIPFHIESSTTHDN